MKKKETIKLKKTQIVSQRVANFCEPQSKTESNIGVLERLVKELLPPTIKCAPETRQLLSDCCIGLKTQKREIFLMHILEFIHMVASEANDLQTKEKKKIMSPEHMLAALEVHYSCTYDLINCFSRI